MDMMKRLSSLFDDPEISEVMINGPSQVYAEKNGRLKLVDIAFDGEGEVYELIKEILAPLGKKVDASSPLADGRLADGSRVNIIIPPASLTGPMITIRRFAAEGYTPQALAQRKALSESMLLFLELCVKSRRNIVVAGGTGSGKTTLLNTLSSFIDAEERIITIEDTAELQLMQPHVGRLEALHNSDRREESAVTIRDLIRNTLRMRPDRILVGECRGGETLDMLQAMNTGHKGCMTTVHANSPRDCVKRIETMVLMAGFDLPLRAIREQIASAVQIIVFTSRGKDGVRRITEITEVTGMEGETITMAPVYICQSGNTEQPRFAATGYIPVFIEQLRSQGYTIEPDLFE